MKDPELALLERGVRGCCDEGYHAGPCASFGMQDSARNELTSALTQTSR